MAKERTQLNINIQPELLLLLKSEAIKEGKTLTRYVIDKLNNSEVEPSKYIDSLESRLLKLEQHLDLDKIGSKKKNQLGTIFTDEGARKYGEVAKELFELAAKKKGLSIDNALKELALFLNQHSHSDPELVFQLLLGTHALTGVEMTKAYRLGSCAMRTALCDWAEDTLEELNEAFLNAVITKSLK